MVSSAYVCPKCKGRGAGIDGCFTPAFNEGRYACEKCGYRFRVREYFSDYEGEAPIIKILPDRWTLSFDKGSFWGSFGYTMAFMYMVMGIVFGSIGLIKGSYILSILSFGVAVMNVITLRKFS